MEGMGFKGVVLGSERKFKFYSWLNQYQHLNIFILHLVLIIFKINSKSTRKNFGEFLNEIKVYGS